MGEAHVLTDDCSVLALNQGVVVGPSRPRLGLFDVKLVQEKSDGVIDVLATIVGVKIDDHEWEQFEQFLKQRPEKFFADSFNTTDDLPLSNLIYQIDMVYALFLVQIALVHRIHP